MEELNSNKPKINNSAYALAPRSEVPYQEISIDHFDPHNFKHALETKDQNEKINLLISKFELEALQNIKAEFLSGGQKKRLVISLALLSDPKILLLDEPFSALDLDMSIKLINDVRALLKDRSCSAILVTHNIEEAKLFSDRMIDLSKV